jgi:hypothetical protein
MTDSATYLSAVAALVGTFGALRMIVDTYAEENTTFSGIKQSIGHGFSDPLRVFSEACHQELRMY